MTGQNEDFLTEYRKLMDLCEKYQMDGIVREFRDRGLDGRVSEGTEKAGEQASEERRILRDLRKRIGSSLKENLELAYENKRIYDRALVSFTTKMEQDYQSVKDKLLSYMDGQYYELGRDQALTVVWLKCGSDLTVYGELFSYKIRESGVKEYCEELIRTYRKLLREEVSDAIEHLNWFRRSDSPVEAIRPAEWEEKWRPGESREEEVYLADDFLFRLLQTANSYGFGNAVKLLSDARLLQKAIEIGQKALMWYLDSCSEQCNEHLLELQRLYSESFEQALREGFLREVGHSPEEVLREIWDTELDMTENGLYGEVPYYPIRKDGRLEFLQSLYYRELVLESEDDGETVRPGAKELCEWAKTMVFEPYYAERMGDAKSRIYGVLFSYNGSSAVKMPLIAQGTENMIENKELERFCPFFRKIQWGAYRDRIQEIYLEERKAFQEWCAIRWNEQCKDREKEAVRQCLMFYQDIFEREIASFMKIWKLWRSDVAKEPRMQESARQAALNLDAFTYYQWYYYPAHPGEHTLRFLFEYRQSGKISVYLTRQIRIVDTKGESLVPRVSNQMMILFDDYLVQVTAKLPD